MFTSNAFAAVSGSLPAGFMQWFVGLMILAVIIGTLLDVVHKGSATYFFANWRKTRGKGAPVDVASIAVKTVVVDVLASGEFCNPRRRVAHLLTMYGFVLYLVTTMLMVYVYPTAATPTPRRACWTCSRSGTTRRTFPTSRWPSSATCCIRASRDPTSMA